MLKACAEANMSPSDVGFIAASANGTVAGDTTEAAAIADVAGDTPVAAYKSKTGECYGASGALSLASALADMKAGRVSGTREAYRTPPNLNLVTETLNNRSDETALLNAFSCDGNCGSIVLKNR
jgi:3-oxoacyl-(acyl-carrier-protein) synthase